jgi:hypothetical protein
MTYQEAKEIGELCGLETPEEFIRNIQYHCMNLFAYTNIVVELQELKRTAEEAGIKWL